MKEMTEKEKALELIGKYQKHAMLKDFGGMDFEIARGCAMIGLDEMLDHIEAEAPSHIYQWFKRVRIELERIEQLVCPDCDGEGFSGKGTNEILPCLSCFGSGEKAD